MKRTLDQLDAVKGFFFASDRAARQIQAHRPAGETPPTPLPRPPA